MNYSIQGEPLSVVICNLDENETMITESGSMSWMSPNLEMSTNAGGSFGKAFGRLLGGESIFQNRYTAVGGKGMIAFASSFPGSIRAIEITPDKPIIAQKSAFLAGTDGIELSVSFQKRLSTGFFGGEGFIMQKISGTGLAFVEIDGTAIEYELAEGQQLVIDTGYLAYMESSCTMTVQSVKGLKNKLFGGEGIFNTVVTGPGKVVVQSMPMSKFAMTVAASLPSNNN